MMVPLRPNRFAADQDGSTLVEFVLVIPIFFLLVFGVIDFARIGYANVLAETGTRIAVRTAVVQPAACEGVPKVTRRGVVGLLSLDLANGTPCTTRDGLCHLEDTVSCNGSLENATVATIWARIEPLMPTGAQPENLRFSYNFDENLNRVGAPYAPVVTVEIADLQFDFISPLGALANLASAQTDSTLGQSFAFSSMSASLPSEDLR